VIQLTSRRGCLFDDQSFDVVLSARHLQHLRQNTEKMLLRDRARRRIGPSLSQIRRLAEPADVASGRIPVTKWLPYQW